MVAGAAAETIESRQKQIRGSGKQAPLKLVISQTEFYCPKSSIEIPQEGVEYIQS